MSLGGHRQGVGAVDGGGLLQGASGSRCLSRGPGDEKEQALRIAGGLSDTHISEHKGCDRGPSLLTWPGAGLRDGRAVWLPHMLQSSPEGQIGRISLCLGEKS